MIRNWFSRSAPAAEPEPQRKAPPMLTVPRRRGSRMFQAAETDRMTSGWTNTPMPADQIIRRNWRVLVARSREQSANNDYAKAFKRSARRNLIGQRGFVLQAQARDGQGKLDSGANTALERAWSEWCRGRNCDVKGRRSFRQIQKTLVNGLCTDGEFMVRFVYGRDAGPWGFALQVLDPVLCPVDFDEDRRPGGGFIRAGIEYTKLGRPVAYYFTTLDQTQADYHYSGRAFVRVPADEIVHWFEEDFVGQKRGLPWMATALLRMRQLGDFEKSALNNARESAKKFGVIEWDEGYGPADSGDDDEGGEDGDELREFEIESEDGVYQELPMGARLKGTQTAYPNGEMAVFSKHQLRGIATGLGVAYNDLANDLEGVNLSSIRHGVLSERDHWQELQESLIEAFAIPVYERWLEVALLRQRITLDNGSALPAAKRTKFLSVMFQARRWQWIDPAKDVKADADAVENMFKSRGQVIRERGRDPREVYAEIAADIEDMRAAKIPEEIIMSLITEKPKGGQGNGQQANPAAGKAGEGADEGNQDGS